MNQSTDALSGSSSLSRKLEAITANLADKIVGEIEKQPNEPSRHLQMLEDCRHAIVRESAQATHFGSWSQDGQNFQEFLWNMANRLPSFNIEALYRKRSSLPGLAGAIVIGWFVGGAISTLLNLFSLGGEILRPLAIFLAIWLEEYISINPKARKLLLTILGLGGLARFASLAMGGFIRFSGFGALRQAIFGVARPNIFKTFWLMTGAIFILIFLSKKITGLDIPAFKQSLTEQIGQRLGLCCYVLENMAKEAKARAKLAFELENDQKKIDASSNNRIIQAITGILPALDPPSRKFLRSTLAESGIELQGEDAGVFIWNTKEHAPLYTTVGLISDGDRAKILEEPYIANGKTVRGHAQKIQ